jgi:tRNA pseudouridine13 synthase
MQASVPTLSWPTTGAPPLTQAILRAAPEDFEVEEINNISLAGAGEHLWLKLRKRGVNTEFVARQLARAAGVPARAVSYAGLKDRHALATQWFSLHLPGREVGDLAARLPAQIEVLEQSRHARKLQRGALQGNRFRIVLRQCAGDRAALSARVQELERGGVPNYFGEQRFGRDGANIARARAMFAGESIRDRHLRGIYLSAARSLLFNEVLARRIDDGSWCQAREGDAFVLNGSNSFFVPELIDEAIVQRLSGGDIHPSGPLWGEGEPPSRAAVRELECGIAARHAELAAGLAGARLQQERRPLRVLPAEVAARWRDDATLELAFALPAGSYATAVVRELAHYRDQGGAEERSAAS